MKSILLLSIICMTVLAGGMEEGLQTAQKEVSSAIARSAELGCALSGLLERYANAIAVTNKWDVHVVVSNRQCSLAFAYSRSDLAFPKMASKRGVDGAGCDVYFGGRHNLTKYIEYKDGTLHGLWLEFFVDGRLRSYVKVHNGKTVGQRLFFDDNGRLVKECSDTKSLLDIPIKSSPRDGIDNPK